jgi:hypothetical protein
MTIEGLSFLGTEPHSFWSLNATHPGWRLRSKGFSSLIPSDPRDELQQAESRDAVAWVFDETQQRQNVSDVRSVEELKTAVFDERNIPSRQLNFERSAVMRCAEQDRLLLQRRSPFSQKLSGASDGLRGMNCCGYAGLPTPTPLTSFAILLAPRTAS